MKLARALWRLLAAVSTIVLGLLICALFFPFWSEARRMRCVGWWSSRMLASVGVRLKAGGVALNGPVLLSANHVSWLDILAINAVAPAHFVSKAEVRRWPLVGWLAASAGTIFIERQRRRDSLRVAHAIASSLGAGQRVAVFPEGTVGDGETLLPFHGNLLQAAIAAEAPLQPVAIRYGDDASRRLGLPSSRVTAYDGDVTIATSACRVLMASGLEADVRFLPVVETALDRRALAAHVRRLIDVALRN